MPNSEFFRLILIMILIACSCLFTACVSNPNSETGIQYVEKAIWKKDSIAARKLEKEINHLLNPQAMVPDSCLPQTDSTMGRFTK